MKLNVIDQFIGFINPKWGSARAKWRSEYEYQRGNYDASDTGRLQSQWNTLNQSAEFTDRYERDRIRARARDLERNSDTMNAVLRAFRRNVIGSGLQVRVTTQDGGINSTFPGTSPNGSSRIQSFYKYGQTGSNFLFNRHCRHKFVHVLDSCQRRT